MSCHVMSCRAVPGLHSFKTSVVHRADGPVLSSSSPLPPALSVSLSLSVSCSWSRSHVNHFGQNSIGIGSHSMSKRRLSVSAPRSIEAKKGNDAMQHKQLANVITEPSIGINRQSIQCPSLMGVKE